MMAMRLVAFPGVVYSDFQYLLDGLDRGREWCVCPERRYATAWTLVWSVIADMEMPDVRKVKAHTAFKASLSVLERRLRAGNAWADAFAKAGAAKHPSNAAMVEDHVARAQTSGRVLKWAGEALGHWPMVDADTRAGDAAALLRPGPRKPPPRRKRKPRIPADLGGHVLVPGDGGAYACRLCGTCARSPKAACALAATECDGGMLARLPADTWDAFRSHRLCFAPVGRETGARPPLFWCSWCFAFASRFDCCRDLQRPCCGSVTVPKPPPAHKAAAARRLRAGLYPSAKGLLKDVTLGLTVVLSDAELCELRRLALAPRGGSAPVGCRLRCPSSWRRPVCRPTRLVTSPAVLR
jgi:hypothetical protein